MDWLSYHKGNRRWPSVGSSVGALGMTAVQNPIILGLGAYSASKWLKHHNGNKNESQFTPPGSPALSPTMASQSPLSVQGPKMNGYAEPYAYQGGYAQGVNPQNYNGSTGMPPLDLNGGGMYPASLAGAAYTPSQAGYSQGTGGYVPVQGSNANAYAGFGNRYGAFGTYEWK